jgi:hypothetical protein
VLCFELAREAARVPLTGVSVSGSRCNNVVDQSELATMVPQVTQRLFLYLAAFLVALLPLEATYAANGCAPVTAMTDHGSDCGDCMYDERRQCQTYCLALCQSLPASRASFLEACDLSSLIYLPLLANFPPVPDGGPEPPPPRILR